MSDNQLVLALCQFLALLGALLWGGLWKDRALRFEREAGELRRHSRRLEIVARTEYENVDLW